MIAVQHFLGFVEMVAYGHKMHDIPLGVVCVTDLSVTCGLATLCVKHI